MGCRGIGMDVEENTAATEYLSNNAAATRGVLVFSPTTAATKVVLNIFANNRSHEGPLSNMHLKTRAPLRGRGPLLLFTH